MAFTSQLYKNEIVLSDDMPRHEFERKANLLRASANMEVISDGEFGRGRVPRDLVKYPFGATPFLKTWDGPRIPRSEWVARIQEREARGQRNSQIVRNAKIPSLNQGGTNYCWCNAVITMIDHARAKMGLPYIPLSPASVAAIIKNYRNVGGWGGEAIEYIAAHGVAPQSVWPANAIDRRYDNDESRKLRQMFIIGDWVELPARDFEALMSHLLMDGWAAVGYNWWSHEVFAADPVIAPSGRPGVRLRNSWADDYGDLGYFILEESKANPDDAVSLINIASTPDLSLVTAL